MKVSIKHGVILTGESISDYVLLRMIFENSKNFFLLKYAGGTSLISEIRCPLHFFESELKKLEEFYPFLFIDSFELELARAKIRKILARK